MAKALVLGARGQLGSELLRELKARGHTAVGLGREKLDITRADLVEQAMRLHRPGWLLNAAAYAEKVYVIRTAGVFGPAGRTTNRGNFVELMLRMAAEGRAIRVVEDFYASPAYACPWRIPSVSHNPGLAKL